MTMTGPIAERCLEKHAGKVSLLCKISSYSPVSPTQDAVFGTVDSAIALGADAVSMGCMTLGDFQNEQFEAIGKVAQECRLKGMPLSDMYIRRERVYRLTREHPGKTLHTVYVAHVSLAWIS